MSDIKKKKPGVPFAWWNTASLQRIAELATQAAAAGGRVEDHELTDGSRYLEFYDAAGKEIGGENDSFLCPPICWP